jgi:hypothetical protein
MPPAKLKKETERALTEFFGDSRPTRWVTRERPKIDRIACPWAIRRFIDPDAEIIYTPTSKVFDVAKEKGAVAFDIPGAPISHEGELCSFDTLIKRFALDDPALQVLARIVRGADTDHHSLAPESAGLHAISLGLSKNYTNDHALLTQGMVVYDALYSWATSAKGERHDWRPSVQ